MGRVIKLIVENLFETKIFPELKQYVEENSIYDPSVVEEENGEAILVLPKLSSVVNQYNDLSYSSEIYTFKIEIRVIVKETVGSKKTIGNEVTEVVIDYFKKNYRLTIQTELDVSNDSSYQNAIKVMGNLDTNCLVISPSKINSTVQQ